jgi:hypothetical protein
MPLSTKAAAFQISTLMRFFERPGGFVDVIIPQIAQKEKPTCTANASRQYLSTALTARKI